MQAQHLGATLALYNMVKGQVHDVIMYIIRVFINFVLTVNLFFSSPPITSLCTNSFLQPTEMCGWSGETANSNNRRRVALLLTNLEISSSLGSSPDSSSSSRTSTKGRTRTLQTCLGRPVMEMRSLKSPGRTWLVLTSRRKENWRTTVTEKKEGGEKRTELCRHPGSSY